MSDPKNPPEFYAARDDVDGGLLPKRNMRTLRKHRAALLVRRDWEGDPSTAEACYRKAQWLAKIEKEIENRKKQRRDFWKDVALRVFCPLLAGLILFFATRMILTRTTQTGRGPESQSRPTQTSDIPARSYSHPFTNNQQNVSNQAAQATSLRAEPEH